MAIFISEKQRGADDVGVRDIAEENVVLQRSSGSCGEDFVEIRTHRCPLIKPRHRAASLANRPGKADTAMCRRYVAYVKVDDDADKDADCCGA